jgi:hypothetical protein
MPAVSRRTSPPLPQRPVGRDNRIDLLMEFRFTEYFERQVLRKRPYLRKEWCITVVQNPIRFEPQEHNRYRFWAVAAELGGRYLRVITLEDKVTIHNAFPDRRFRP